MKIIKGKYRTKLEAAINKIGVTQRQLARATNIKCYLISGYVSGKKKDMLLSTAKKICKVMDCTLSELFEDEE